MDYAACLNYIETFQKKKAPRENGRHLQVMEALLQRFGIDHRAFDIVQITGSCGKGSTAAFVSSVLREAGIAHGLFTGPHLSRYEERFAVDGKMISPDELAAVVSEIAETTSEADMRDAGHKHLMTLIAFLWFKKKGVRLIVYENGAGGASDPSNIFKPLVACLTEITLDHTKLLGDTIEAITSDKSAIIKPETKWAVCGMRNKSARRYMQTLEARSKACFLFIDRDYAVASGPSGLTYTGGGIALRGLRLGLKGHHQQQNAANALRIIECLREAGFAISERDMVRGLARVDFPGRMEERQWEGVPVILDGAHNPLELKALKESLHAAGFHPAVVLTSFVSGKNPADMLEALALPAAHYAVVPSPFAARRVPRTEVEAAFRTCGLSYTYYEELADAWTDALRRIKSGEGLLVTGSLYLVGAVRARFFAERREKVASR